VIPLHGRRYTISAEVWLYPGDAPWHFVTLPPDVADEIKARTAGSRRGFGSVPVEAKLGAISWETSLFPDSKSASYLLPIKAQVRRRERVEAGDEVTITLALREQGP
jgi:hypothetical protein